MRSPTHEIRSEYLFFLVKSEKLSENIEKRNNFENTFKNSQIKVQKRWNKILDDQKDEE